MMVGRWVSFWDCLLLEAMLNFRGVLVSWNETPLKNGIVTSLTFLLWLTFMLTQSLLEMTDIIASKTPRWKCPSITMVKFGWQVDVIMIFHASNPYSWQYINWLVVSTPLKNMSQNGNLPQRGVKRKSIWNHHTVNLHMSYIGNSAGPRRRTNFAAQILQL